MNFAQLQDAVLIYLQDRQDVRPEDVKQAINDAQQAISTARTVLPDGKLRQLSFPELETRNEVQLVAGTEGYALPTRAFAVHAVQYVDGTDVRKLFYKTPEAFTTMPPNSGYPHSYTFHQNTLYVRDVPDANYAKKLWIWYSQYPATLSGSSDTPLLPDAWHSVIAIKAAALVSRQYGFSERAVELEQQFMNEVQLRGTTRDVPVMASRSRIL